MHRYLFAVLVLFALLVPSVHTTVHAAPSRVAVSADAARVVQLINVRRAAAGLRPVTINATLMAEAQRFSRVQAALGRLTHRGADNTTAGQRLTRAGYRWGFYGENLAAGQQTPAEVVAAWMTSPGHRANILAPQAREIGIGHTVRANDPSRYFDYWAMEAGRPR